MPKNGVPKKAKAQELYDRVADVQNLAMKVNGYRASVAKYLRFLELDLNPDSLVLDAGSGTGLVTGAFLDCGMATRRIVSLDLSFKSLKVARESIGGTGKHASKTDSVQGNVLNMPFDDNTFDLVLMCGVLEYTPLDDGLSEAARILKKGAPLVLLPVKPSIVGSVLELLYNFKIHPIHRVREAATQYFDIVGNHEFPITEPIAWSKTIFLLKKR